MVVFKKLKYKHRRQAGELMASLDQENPDQEAIDRFVMSLVKDWDYIDEETGQKVEIGDLDNLALEQYKEIMAEFNRQMNDEAEVKKTNDEPSPSGSTPSKPARKSSRPRRSGST